MAKGIMRDEKMGEKRRETCPACWHPLHKEEDKHLSYIGVTNHPASHGAPIRPTDGGRSGHGRVREGECAEA